MSTLFLVRHGQASFEAEDYDQLSALGGEQARLTGLALRGRVQGLAAAYTGTLRRHRQTAERCLAALEVTLTPAALPGLDEFDHQEILARFDPRYAERAALVADLVATADPHRTFQDLFARAVARWMGGAHDADYTVPWAEFRRRSLSALEEVAAGLERSGTALVFTSVGPITAVCQALLEGGEGTAAHLAWSLVNCGITKLVRGERGLRLASFNDHAHLERDPRWITRR